MSAATERSLTIHAPSASSFPSAGDFLTMKELGTMAVKSGFLPVTIKTPEQAVIIMLKGRELGIPPMQAFSSIAVVNGKPTMSAELMLAMIYKSVPGVIVNFLASTATECTIEAKRPRGKASKWAFTIADAQKADLADKGVWKTYPAAMLRARCISAMARAMFPDALSGVVYTPEEMGEEVSEEGEIIQAFGSSPSSAPEVLPPEKTRPKNPLKTEPTGAFCSGHGCGKELVLGPSGAGYFCPDEKNETTGPHARFRKERLAEYLAQSAPPEPGSEG